MEGAGERPWVTEIIAKKRISMEKFKADKRYKSNFDFASAQERKQDSVEALAKMEIL